MKKVDEIRSMRYALRSRAEVVGGSQVGEPDWRQYEIVS